MGRLSHLILIASIVLLVCPLSIAADTRIVPLQVRVSITPKSARSNWTVPIKSTDGRTLCVLRQEAEYSGGGELEGVDLVLRRANSGPKGENLLAPIGNWHGTQAFIFAADDFVAGASKSTYGKERTITVPTLELVVHIRIQASRVSPIPSEDFFQLDRLDLVIDVDNLHSRP